MKKLMFRALSIMAMLLVVSCQSKEEKAAEFIKENLYKTLYDFESYSPIETIVTEAKMTMYNDSACWHKAAAAAYMLKKATKYAEDANDAQESMNIWEPTYYSSSYSYHRYNKYKEEYEENMSKVNAAVETFKVFASKLKELIANLDTTKVIGWEVKHRFRCKTKGGNSAIGNYRYILDKDFKNNILLEDLDDEDDAYIRDFMRHFVSGDLDQFME